MSLSPQRARRRKRLILAGVLVLAPLLYLGALGWWLNNWGSRDRAQNADAILIFGSGVRENGTASPTLRARTHHAYGLWQRGLAPTLVCTGGIGTNPPAEAVVQEKLLRSWGVPASAIVREEKSTSTWENARFAAPLLPPGATVIAVSDPYHLWRCKRDCAQFGMVAYPSPSLANWARLPARSRAFFCVREAILVTRDLVLGALRI